MTMNTTELLGEIRELVKCIEEEGDPDHIASYAVRMTRSFKALDDALYDGDPLPESWTAHR
ncbi:hypothetical protein AB0K16_22255 [Nonomuraea jabiensis]|uniref:hypothetical protein n=1 Tax=Nonomuraea jabiensis TaxID=882448 RepID=UPI0034362F19